MKLLQSDIANAKHFSPCTFSHTKPASFCFIQRKTSLLLPKQAKISHLKIKGKARMSYDVLYDTEKVEHDAKKHEPEDKNENGMVVINGTVTLMKKTILGFNAIHSSVFDLVDELAGRKVSLWLVSADSVDPANDMKGKLSKPAVLGDWISTSSGWKSSDLTFKITFEWNEEMGAPGALIIRNEHRSEFYLKSITLDGINHGKVHFPCNSWVYPAHRYKKDRIFFSNKTYLPHETPAPLSSYRAEELETLRGNGEGKLKKWDRTYDYACYNDLGDPDKGQKYVRPILGGSKDYPYPRRGRTGRALKKTDPNYESRLPLLLSINIYVPRDEQLGPLKMAEVLTESLNTLVHALQGVLRALFTKNPTEFDCMEDALSLYEEGIRLSDGNGLLAPLKFPLPHIIKEDKFAWRSDEEFTRQMLAGVNPLVIRRLEEFPPVSKLNPKEYGNQGSTITTDHIERSMDGLTVEEAIKNKRLFILDHHDTLMPYLRRINTTSTKTYATRTLLLLENDGTLKPLAIELSLPHKDGDHLGAVSKVYTPAKDGVEGSIWQLAKAYVSVNDSGYHQLISHWLHTHAVIEPFVIATNRQLSVLHPIHKLLHPHFQDTMIINALARQILIGAEGIFEKTVFPRKYALEMSSAMYKNWVFTDQALPKDLIKRGMAVKDTFSPHGYRLLIQDYPYAVDGLDIWSAIESWVRDYCSIYYKTNETVLDDTELQAWWKEVREKGHGDLKDQPWWPEMNTIEELTEICTIIIWVASALHAAVNFGQYPYAGFLPNRPTVSRRFMPEPGTPEYEELKTKPETAFLRTITSQFQTLLGVSVIEILSRHSSDEVYLGERESPEWSSDSEVIEVFERFGKRLKEIEGEIMERNACGKWRNRVGPVSLPYTLLVPSSEGGITAKGIPNSVSI